MKKEFGKWLMDIAKYMVTALLLSTIFADMAEPIILWMVIISSMVVLGFGLYWVNESDSIGGGSTPPPITKDKIFGIFIVLYGNRRFFCNLVEDDKS